MRFSIMRFSRSRRLRGVAAAAAVAFTLTACQSQEEKIATFMENGAGYAEADELGEAVIEYRNVLQLDPNHALAHFELAKAYLELGRGKDAYWELSEAVRLAPENVEARLTLGGLSMIARNYQEALEQAEKTLELDPSRSSAHLLYAQALERLERVEEAEDHYLRAIDADPESGPYRLVTAGYYIRRGDRGKAEPMLRAFTEVEPGFRSYTSLARFQADDEARVSEAIASFEQAVEASTEDNLAAAIQNLATYKFALGKRAEATALLESSIESRPLNSDGKLDLIYLLARFYRAEGNVEGADDLIESATAAQPNDVKPYLILSAYRGRQGDLEAALAAAEAALEVDPGHTKAKLRKAELLIDLGYRGEHKGQIALGRGIVDEVLEREPTSPDGLFVLGKAELAVNNVDAAVRALRAAVDSRPHWAQAHFVLGSALTLVGETSAARAEVARAVELDSDMLEARRMLAKLHAALGEHEYAVEQGRVCLKVNPGDLKTRILVAQSLLRIGRAEEAIAELDALPEREWNAEVLYARARLSVGQKDLPAARRMLLRAARLEPHHAEILAALLSVDRATDQMPEAVALIEQARAARPESAELARLHGMMSLYTGNPEQAEKSLQEATRLNPDDMAAYQQLASFYQAAGRLDETLETYRRALEKQPNNARLHHFVAVLYELSGRVDEAMVAYEEAIELDPNLGQSKNNLAYLLAEANRDLDRALNLAQDAKQLMPDNGNAADTLGWVLYKRGVSSAAVGYLKEAVAAIDPTSPTIGVVRHHLALAYEANDQKRDAIETLEIALADLEQRQGAIRERGGRPQEPDWSGPAQDMLTRLKPAG
jgi:tetratricopeptide (TPR) repeat protein